MVEISHRCPSCGASVRDAEALFCAECGTSLAKDGTETSSATTESHADAVPPKVDISETTTVAEQAPSDKPATEPQSPTRPAINRSPTESHHQHRIADKTRETLHRASVVASAAARGVIEEPVKRVEQIRHVSHTMIEEASYDPSLRFVLVALGLFVMFIILLVASKVMG
jgi:hypothetical protein